MHSGRHPTWPGALIAIVHAQRSLAMLIMVLLVLSCASQPNLVDQSLPSHVIIPVVYATSRNFQPGADDRNSYGSDWSEPSYGIASVALSTRANASARHADWSRWQAAPVAPKKNRQLMKVEAMDRAGFDVRLGQRIEAAPDSSVLVYVHGYARGFKGAAIDAALLAYRLDFQGTVLLFSWPSRGSPVAYGQDVVSVERSADHLSDLLTTLTNDDRIGQVHVVAHSLGNRGLADALSGLRDAVPHRGDLERQFGHIVLFAPDLDADRFREEVAPGLRDSGARVTLYVARLDIPLLASAAINGSVRVGDATAGALIEQGIDTVDSSPATNPFGAHLAHLNNPVVVSDLHYLLNLQLAASDRPTLQRVDDGSGQYWQTRPKL